jgi:CRISPR/Cas system CSM-associated protein Csm3 (group 7 of RAMP superfamily)
MLKAEAPFRVGTGQKLSLDSDAPVLLDGDGKPYIPGTSIRGVLRHHLLAEASLLGCGKTQVDDFFGRVPVGADNPDQTWLGRLTIEDARLEQGTKQLEVRDHVRIDPTSGAAKDGAKFDDQVTLANGAVFRFCAAYEGSAKDPELALFREAVRYLQSGEMRIGAKSAWGYGQVRLSEVEYRAFDRGQGAGLAGWLAARLGLDGAPPWTGQAPVWAPPDEPLAADDVFCTADFDLNLYFEGPMLVRAPLPPAPPDPLSGSQSDPATYPKRGECVADHIFLTSGGADRYCLPGSSLRGVLRAQARHICAAVGTRAAEAEELVFGPMLRDGDGEDKKWKKGRIEVSDGTVLGTATRVYLDHVAIDRITAAATDGAKFSTCGLVSPCFQVHIRVRFLPGELDVVRLWGRLLRDLMRAPGSLWAGGGTSRGYGYLHHAEVSKTTLSVPATFAKERQFDFLNATTEERRGRKVFQFGKLDRFSDLAPLWKLDGGDWAMKKEGGQ